jgi:protein SCO1/2
VLCAGCGLKTHEKIIVHVDTNDGVTLNPPTAAPAFLLRDQSGTLVGPQQFKGHWTIVTFLYTHCPDVCPLIANNLGAAQRQNKDLRVIAVSVDPKRDTPAAVKRFLADHNLGLRFRYVIGSTAALSRVWSKYHVASTPGPKGTVTHSTFEILVDPKGKERVYYDARMAAKDVLASIKGLS